MIERGVPVFTLLVRHTLPCQSSLLRRPADSAGACLLFAGVALLGVDDVVTVGAVLFAVAVTVAAGDAAGVAGVSTAADAPAAAEISAVATLHPPTQIQPHATAVELRVVPPAPHALPVARTQARSHDNSYTVSANTPSCHDNTFPATRQPSA